MTKYVVNKELQEAIKAYKPGDTLKHWFIEYDDLVKIGQTVWRFDWLLGLRSFVVKEIECNNGGYTFYSGEGIECVRKDKVILDPHKEITIKIPAGRWYPKEICFFCEDYSWGGDQKDKKVCVHCFDGYDNFRLSKEIKVERG